METLKSILSEIKAVDPNPKLNVIANIEIEPLFALAETAALLGRALGGMCLKPTGRYDEYPAFSVDEIGLHIALLGIPEPETDIRDEPSDSYELQISPLAVVGHVSQPYNISRDLAPRLQDLLGIPCAALE